MATKIERCDETWNPITGCTKISEGCKNCYAEQMAKRLSGRYGYPSDDPFRVTLHREQLAKPTRYKKPRNVFVGSMGDLFHEDVEDDWLQMVFNTMESSRWYGHKFMLLTKRPENILNNPSTMKLFKRCLRMNFVWLGVTVENQEAADQRIPQLLQIPAAIRFVSVEPMLEKVNIPYHYLKGESRIFEDSGLIDNKKWPKIDWVLCGGESGNRARPMHPDWAMSLRDQCLEAKVPFLFKQWGTYKWEEGNPLKVGKKHSGRILDGRTWDQFPEGK